MAYYDDNEIRGIERTTEENKEEIKKLKEKIEKIEATLKDIATNLQYLIEYRE